MAGSKTILCIEDDRFISDMYARSLKRAGHTVDVALSGTEGLAKALAGAYNVILLDIMLPEKQGTEVLQELRGTNFDKVPHSHIIVLTNFDQDEESRAVMQSKADAYLIKAEITPRKLVEIIEKLPQR
ncbi:MAG TPA: response regulator [Candidatus Saccharimonadales bacterium]